MTAMQETIGERVRRLRKALGLTQGQVVQHIPGMTASALSQIETGETKTVQGPNLVGLARALGVSVEELADGVRGASEPLPNGKYIFVREYSAIAGLGNGHFNEQHVEVAGTHAYRVDELRAKGLDPGSLAIMYGQGDSMSPTINHGDRLLINLAENSLKNVVSGKIYAIEDADHGSRVKRLHRTLDGRIRVASDNEDKRQYPDDYLTPDSGSRIIGRVVDRSGGL